MNSPSRYSSGSRQNFLKARASREGNQVSCTRISIWALLFIWFAFVLYFLASGNFVTTVLTTVKDESRGDGLKNGGIKGVPINYIEAVAVPEAQEAPPVGPGSDFHVIFSTDCGTYQDWQTLVLFHSATVVGQLGPITRIASGCDEEKKKVLTDLYKKLYPHYHVHFTPDFKTDAKSKKSYDFYNKPWGVKHWLANANPKIQDGVAVALIDPDMILIRPIVKEIRGMQNNLYNKKTSRGLLQEVVALGAPVAQIYGLGAPWTNDTHLKFDRTRVCGEGSPCLKVEKEFGEDHFAVGPPYILIKEDMVRLVERWTQFVPRVFEKYPYLLAEMYAYSMAAAHEELPHFQMYNYMVSDVEAGAEGWSFIDALDDACAPPVDGIFFPGEALPNVVHYCQTYRVGGIGWTKRDVPRDMFSCDQPMFVEPPRDIISSTTRIRNGNIEKMKQKTVKRTAYMVCVIHRAINAAIMDYKTRMCGGQPVNTEKTLIVLPHG